MMIKTFALFVATALAEITGCYLLWLWLRLVDGVPLASTDILGGAVALVGMGIIVSGWGTAA